MHLTFTDGLIWDIMFVSFEAIFLSWSPAYFRIAFNQLPRYVQEKYIYHTGKYFLINLRIFWYFEQVNFFASFGLSTKTAGIVYELNTLLCTRFNQVYR